MGLPICYHQVSVKKLWFILVLLLLFSAGGCIKREEPVSADSPPGGRPETGPGKQEDAQPGSSPRPGTIQLETNRQTEEDRGGEQEVLEVGRASGMEAFLAIRNGAWIGPEDFVIGLLQVQRTGDEDTASLLALAREFFGNLSGGKIREDLVSEEWRSGVRESLDFYVREDLVPDRVRIGEIVEGGGGSARCNVRLYRDGGVSAGEVYFVKKVDTWYISDLQVDFSLLSEPYVPDPEPFEPGMYAYLEAF